MITTAAGLIVAIPAYLGYRYLLARVSGLMVEMEEDSLDIANLISETRAQKESPDASQEAGGEDA